MNDFIELTGALDTKRLIRKSAIISIIEKKEATEEDLLISPLLKDLKNFSIVSTGCSCSELCVKESYEEIKKLIHNT